MAPDSDQDQLRQGLRQASLAMSIPMLLLAGPVVGFLLAGLAARWVGWPPRPLQALGVVLGLVAAGRETLRIVRRIQSMDRENQQ